ncbi:MAG TPA: hypothetical protein VN730_00685 [Steroidobacteraceae bacterium]|nr:hypothetical protein [Steroidobacteraceae bacterium]
MTQQPATALSVLDKPAIVDDRPRFRALFCEVLRETKVAVSGDCGAYLWRLPDEKPPEADRLDEDRQPGRARVLIFGGAFGDCFPPWSVPFADATAASESAGFDIDIVPVSGRSSSEHNARTVRDKVLAAPHDDEPLILLGYSKGAVDILEALVRYPDVAARVAAVLSISGAINGSPLAARYLRLYRVLLRHRKIGACGPGDGRVLESLQPTERLKWLSANPLPRGVRYYSIVTFATGERVARMLAHTQRILSKLSPRNDGQLLAEDQLIPGGALLGFVNADHWSVAVRLEDRFPFLAHRRIGKHPFPQSVLLESTLRFVLRDLRDRAAAPSRERQP